MAYQVPSTVVHSLPLPMIVYTGKQRFSLFKKVDGHWFQIRTVSYLPEMACRVWAEFVAKDPKSYSIRRSRFDYNEAR